MDSSLNLTFFFGVAFPILGLCYVLFAHTKIVNKYSIDSVIIKRTIRFNIVLNVLFAGTTLTGLYLLKLHPSALSTKFLYGMTWPIAAVSVFIPIRDFLAYNKTRYDYSSPIKYNQNFIDKLIYIIILSGFVLDIAVIYIISISFHY